MDNCLLAQSQCGLHGKAYSEETWLCPQLGKFVAGWLWANCLTSLSLCFHTCNNKNNNTNLLWALGRWILIKGQHNIYHIMGMKQIFIFLTSLHSFICLVIFNPSIATSPLLKPFFYSPNKLLLGHQLCDRYCSQLERYKFSKSIMYSATYALAFMELMVQYRRGTLKSQN